MYVVFYHLDEAEQLFATYLFWVEVVGFRYIQMRYNVLHTFLLYHLRLHLYLMQELLVLILLKIVLQGDLGRVELDQQFCGDGGHQAPRHGEFGQVDVFLAFGDDRGGHFCRGIGYLFIMQLLSEFQT